MAKVRELLSSGLIKVVGLASAIAVIIFMQTVPKLFIDVPIIGDIIRFIDYLMS